MSDQYGFYFEKAGLSRPQGATSSDEEHFKGTSVAESLVRELAQNSLDAVDTSLDGPVRMVFELAEMKISDIPDANNLFHHIQSAHETTQTIDSKNSRLKDAVTAFGQSSMMVLRVGDYGTLGLAGSEGKSSYDAPLVALTRGAGISAAKDGGGGSFGVGSSVGTLASAIHTVFWKTLAKGANEVIFAGYSQLATHKDHDGEYLQPDGFFIDKTCLDDYRYLRSPESLGPFEKRSETGTDTYVLGYLDAVADPGLRNIRDAFVTNFMAAIDRGSLVVEGRSSHGSWILDKDTLLKYVKEVPDAQPFYDALRDPNPYVKEVKGLGELRLYMEFNDNLDRKYHTITMRKPLMRITEYKHTSIGAKYAAILECSNDQGNAKLRALEPPRHDKWEEHRASDGKKTITAVKNFIREGLRSRMETQVGTEIQIKGLEQFLPSQVSNLNLEALKTQEVGLPKNGQGSDKESSTVQGKETGPIKKNTEKARPGGVNIQKSATPSGASSISKGKDTGGQGKRRGDNVGIPGKGEGGKGSSRLPVEALRMRSWSDGTTGNLIMQLNSPTPIEGDLWIRALGSGGEIEEDYILPIKQVILSNVNGDQVIETEGNILKNVKLAGKPSSAQLRIELSKDRRYRLGVI